MEKKKITDEMYKALRKALPKDAVLPHPTKKFLSTIKAIYVVERLNEVFGLGGWTVKNTIVREDGKHIVVKSELTFEEYLGYWEAFGGNDNADLGDAYKGACTDALTKIGSYLGVAMEVFKGQGNNEPKEEPKPQPKATPAPAAEKAPASLKPASNQQRSELADLLKDPAIPQDKASATMLKINQLDEVRIGEAIKWAKGLVAEFQAKHAA